MASLKIPSTSYDGEDGMEVNILGDSAGISPMNIVPDKEVFFEDKSVTPTSIRSKRDYSSNQKSNDYESNPMTAREENSLEDISDLVADTESPFSGGGFLGAFASMKKTPQKD